IGLGDLVMASALTSVNGKRRPLRSRQATWAISLSRVLNSIGVTPNQLSLLSVLFALIASVLQVSRSGRLSAVCFVIVAVALQMRLVCNLLDGLMAVEGGKRSPLGELFNELP